MLVGTFSPGDIGEVPTLSFNFANDLSPNEEIVSVIFLVTVATASKGQDPSPSSRLLGFPGISGLIVSQQLSGCLTGVTYVIEARVTTSFSNVYSDWGYYPVGTPA